MHFYHPNFLYGLIALIIPLIIHLFNFKRFKKVYFANISFLKEIQQQSKRHSQLLHLLIMFLRMLTIAMLVIAFSGPYRSSKEHNNKINEEAYVNIFLDNSFSMQARATNGSLFEEGRSIARQIAMAHKPSDHFRLLSNDKYGFARNFVNREVFIEQLDKIQISKSSIKLSQISNRLNDNGLNITNLQDLYIISDFQKKQSNLEYLMIDSNINLQLIPLSAAAQGNLFVDSVWITTPILQPKKSINVNFEIENNSNKAVKDIPISMMIGDKQKAVSSLSIDAYGKAKSTFNFRVDTAGFYGAKITIEDYPVVYDDVFYFSFSALKQLPILCISGKNSNSDIITYLNSDSLFLTSFMKEEQLNYSSFAQFTSIILNGLNTYSTGLNIELKKYIKNGGNLIIIPNKSNRIEDLNRLYTEIKAPNVNGIDSNSISMQNVDIESPEFKDIFDLPKNSKQIKKNTNLPYFKKHYKVESASNTTKLISDETGQTILNKIDLINGSIYCFYTPIESSISNFSSHAIFVPIIYNILQNKKSSQNLYYYLGSEQKLEIKSIEQDKEPNVILKQVGDSMDFIPQYLYQLGKLILSFQQEPESAGIYNLYNKDVLLSKIAFNYNRSESYLEYYSEKDIDNILKANKLYNVKIFTPISGKISNQIKESQSGTPLWKLFIIIAISFLIIELFLLRYSKY